jgi:hypothetical protein
VCIVVNLRGEQLDVARQGRVRREPPPGRPGTHDERHIDGTGDEAMFFRDNSSRRGSLFGLEKIVREHSFRRRSLPGCRAVLTNGPKLRAGGDLRSLGTPHTLYSIYLWHLVIELADVSDAPEGLEMVETAPSRRRSVDNHRQRTLSLPRGC